jgi:hypothetical protein
MHLLPATGSRPRIDAMKWNKIIIGNSSAVDACRSDQWPTTFTTGAAGYSEFGSGRKLYAAAIHTLTLGQCIFGRDGRLEVASFWVAGDRWGQRDFYRLWVTGFGASDDT